MVLDWLARMETKGEACEIRINDLLMSQLDTLIESVFSLYNLVNRRRHIHIEKFQS